ncbi:MAG: arylesterase [Hyphomicrobiaceae bacterium]
MITRAQEGWTIGRGLIIAAVLAVMVLAPFRAVATNDKPIHLVAFGDSLTAGFGLAPSFAFPNQLATALKDKYGALRVTNAGVSGDTTSGGLARFDWAIPADADAVILELGANDALRGVSPQIARKNLAAILDKLMQRKIPVLVAGMRAPANWGAEYEIEFNRIFADLAKTYDALLYPFFLEGVILRPELKLPDALHPNAEGVKEIVRRILPSVEKLLARVIQIRKGR